MIMVFYGVVPKAAKNKNAAGVWRPAAMVWCKILSQPQVRAQAKPIKEILAPGCVVHLRAVHGKQVIRNPKDSQAGWEQKFVLSEGGVTRRLILF
jgi:hypothetical protein